jgi:hypothetical protein
MSTNIAKILLSLYRKENEKYACTNSLFFHLSVVVWNWYSSSVLKWSYTWEENEYIMGINSLPILLVPLTSACSTCQREKVYAVVNPQLIPKHKHRNTLCGMFLLYPSLTELPSIEIKWALQDVSELGYLFLDKSSLHMIAWDLDLERSQLWCKAWMMSNPVTQ